MADNQCGFSWMSRICKPPYWAFFNADCQIHDDNYTAGGTKEDRLKADLGFLRRMLQDCNHLTDYKRKKKAVMMAIRYYIIVRLFGRISFTKKTLSNETPIK